MSKYETLEQSKVVLLAEHGLGFGEGTISVQAQLRSGELSPEALTIGREIIMNDPDVFVPVDEDAYDDGCGDGRPAKTVFRRIDSATGKTKEYFKKSRRRAKLFGGGLVAASSMWRTVVGSPNDGETVLGDRQFIAAELAKNTIQFGGHTDSHASGENCGCGAIDKYPEITAMALTYQPQIVSVLESLYGDDFADNSANIERVFNRYSELVENTDYFSNASGKASMDVLLEAGAIIKELDANHLEDFIVLNDIDGTTFDQRTFDAKLVAAGIESTAQVFVVDTWRGRMYADAIATIAARTVENVDVQQARQDAYADFLIRTLAVSATLTQNDQPVIGKMYEHKNNFSLAA